MVSVNEGKPPASLERQIGRMLTEVRPFVSAVAKPAMHLAPKIVVPATSQKPVPGKIRSRLTSFGYMKIS